MVIKKKEENKELNNANTIIMKYKNKELRIKKTKPPLFLQSECKNNSSILQS